MPYQISNYVRKIESVTAVRLNEHNIKEIAALIEGDYRDGKDESQPDYEDPNILLGGEAAWLGDWVVIRNKDNINPVEFYSDEEFLGKYHSYSEALAESDRLARICMAIETAMSYVRHPSEVGNSTWDKVVMLAAKNILTI